MAAAPVTLISGDLRGLLARGPLPAEACPLLGADRLHAFRIALAPEVLLLARIRLRAAENLSGATPCTRRASSSAAGGSPIPSSVS